MAEDGFEFEESDLEERFSHASGPGGQNVNKVSTRVTLRHLPSDITVSVQESRSQAENRRIARERLQEALLERRRSLVEEKRHRREKLRRQKSRRPRAVKERILRTKKHRSRVKGLRGKVSAD